MTGNHRIALLTRGLIATRRNDESDAFGAEQARSIYRGIHQIQHHTKTTHQSADCAYKPHKIQKIKFIVARDQILLPEGLLNIERQGMSTWEIPMLLIGGAFA